MAVSGSFGVLPVLGIIESLIEHLTDYSIYMASIKGDNLIDSGKAIIRLFRRNMLLAFTIDWFSLVIFYSSNILVSIFISYNIYQTSNNVTLFISMFYGVVSYGVLHFFSGILMSAIDACWVCYALDIDKEGLRHREIHSAFNAKVELYKEEETV